MEEYKTPERIIYVIGSQGEFPFSRSKLQPWIENINKVLVMQGSNIYVFTVGSSARHYIVGNNVRVLVSKRIKFFRDPLSIDIPFRLILYKKPDLVIIHGLRHALTLISLMIFSIRKTPVLLIVHGLYYGMKLGLLAYLRDLLLKLLLRTVKIPYIMVALTEYDKYRLLKDYKVPKEKIKVAKCFLYVNEEEFKLIQKIREYYTNEELRSKHLLYVGRLSPEKGIDILIRALYKLIRLGVLTPHHTKFIIAGSGPLEKQIVSLIERSALKEYIVFLRSVYGVKKWLAYMSSVALILASKSEGLPRVVFEAFATGNIVIAPNIGGLPEVIHNGVNGFLYNNEDELLKILLYVLSNKEEVLKMGYRNQELTRKKLLFEHNAGEILQIINSLLKYSR